MAKKRNKPYIPVKHISPEVLSRKTHKLSEEIERQKRVLQMVEQSFERHMDLLSNFARHDIGNAVQSLYAGLELSDIEESRLSPIRLATEAIDNALKNFESMVPYTSNSEFRLSKLMIAAETMCRAEMSLQRINYSVEYDRSNEYTIKQPFQALLQLLHNLALNSIKALQNSRIKKFCILASVTNNQCIIQIKDTGCGIPDENVGRIFDYKFTTTPGGTGIGLYHAKYVAEKIGGSISLDHSFTDEYSTKFILKFPLYGNEENINS